MDLKTFLETNKDKTIGECKDEILSFLQTPTKVSNNTNYKINGQVVAIFCYYHKKWEPTCECEYGAKASSTTGLNTMRKEGVSKWTKQQRLAKVAKEELLTNVTNGSIDPSDLALELATIEVERKKVEGRCDGVGYDSLEECPDYIA